MMFTSDIINILVECVVKDTHPRTHHARTQTHARTQKY